MDNRTERFLQNLGRQAEKELYKVKNNEVTEKSRKEMDEFYETKIEKAIAEGKIPPAKRDGWMDKIESKTK